MIRQYLTTFLTLKMAMTYNKIIHFLQKIPGSHYFISDRAYGNDNAKFSISVFQVIGYILYTLVKKAFGVLVFFILAFGVSFIVGVPYRSFDSTGFALLGFTIIWPITNTPILDPTNQLDTIIVRVMLANAHVYTQAKLLYEQLIYIIFTGGFIWYFARAYSILTVLTLISFGILVSLLFNYINLQIAVLINKWSFLTINWLFLGEILLVLMILTVMPIYDISYPIHYFDSWLMRVVIISFFAGIIYLWRQPDFVSTFVKKFVSFETVVHPDKLLAEVERDNVSLDEDESFNLDHKKLEDVSGWDYLYALFFKRTSHLFWKRIRKRMYLFATIAGLLVIGVFAASHFIKVDLDDITRENFLYIAPLFSLWLGSVLALGEDFAKFCFYNLDRHLLVYNFYRQPESVASSINYRFKQSFIYHLPILGLELVVTSALFLFLFQNISYELVITLGIQILAMLFANYHFLILYYIFQPFTEQMSVASPVYKFLNGASGFMFYFFIQWIHYDTFLISWIVIAILMIVYLPVGFFLVKRLAPDRFKLK